MTLQLLYMVQSLYLENSNKEGHRRSHKDSLLIQCQTLKSRYVGDVGLSFIQRYKTGNDSPHH